MIKGKLWLSLTTTILIGMLAAACASAAAASLTATLAAAKDPALIPVLRNYESLYGSDWYLGTKPPGVLAVYLLTLKACNWINPALTWRQSLARITLGMISIGQARSSNVIRQRSVS